MSSILESHAKFLPAFVTSGRTKTYIFRYNVNIYSTGLEINGKEISQDEFQWNLGELTLFRRMINAK